MKEINGVINEAAKALPAETYAAKEEAAYAIGTQAHIWGGIYIYLVVRFLKKFVSITEGDQ